MTCARRAALEALIPNAPVDHTDLLTELRQILALPIADEARLMDLWSEVDHWADKVADPYAGGHLFADHGEGHYTEMDLDLWQEECQNRLDEALDAIAAFSPPPVPLTV